MIGELALRFTSSLTLSFSQPVLFLVAADLISGILPLELCTEYIMSKLAMNE